MPAWSELLQLQWRHPAGALLLVLPLLLGWLARRRRRQLAGYADAALLPWAVQRATADARSRTRRAAEALAWLLLAAAAAGPRLPLATPEAPAGGRVPHAIDVMVVLDVSASMTATDLAPDRLTRARFELQDLLRRVHGERLGLLVYAGQAGLLLPPSEDPALFAHALQQADADLLQAPGTDLARALTLAREQLGRGDPARRRAVLLLTDAEEDSLDGAAAAAVAQAVEALRAADLPLFVLVTASAEGAGFELRAGPVGAAGARALRDGAPVLSRPALADYRRLARRSGGDLALAGAGDAHWARLYDEGLARLPAAAVPADQAQAWRELYGVPLALALLLLLWTSLPPGRRRPAALAAPLVLGAALLGTLAPPSAQAAGPATPDALAAAQAYRQQQWAPALALYERQGGYAGQMGAGAAAWQLRDPARAARHYRQALLLARTAGERDDALYNLGNALYAQQQWLAAAQAWQAVLRSRPGDPRAAANLVHAEAELARRAGTPGKSDLRGRLGFAVEGFVGTEGALTPREEPLLLPELAPGARDDGRAAAAGARLQGAGTDEAAAAALPGAQQLQSGLLKLERLQAHPRELLRGLLRQDRQPAPAGAPGAPW